MKKYFTRCFYLLRFTLGRCLIYYALFYFCVDTDANRIKFKGFYDEDKVDYIITGTSHALWNVDAGLISEMTGKSVYNLATGDQNIKESYYVIKDAIKTKDIKRVYREVSISRFFYGVNQTSVYLVSDNIKSPLIKTEILLSSFEPEKYINSFLRVRRYADPQRPYTWDLMSNLSKKKQSDNYKNNIFDTEGYYYDGKGHWAPFKSTYNMGLVNLTSQNITENITEMDEFTPDKIDDTRWEYFLKIIYLCKKENVELTFLIMPYHESYILHYKYYDEITGKVYDTARKNGIPIVDFNTVKSEFLLLDNSDYYNLDHLLKPGGDKLSKFFALYINNPDGDYFYTDVKARMRAEGDKIYSLGYEEYYLTEKGDYLNKTDTDEDVKSVKLYLSAVTFGENPVDIKMQKVEKPEGQDGNYLVKDEILGEKVGDTVTAFVVPYDKFTTEYRVRVYASGTDDLLYETITNFS